MAVSAILRTANSTWVTLGHASEFHSKENDSHFSVHSAYFDFHLEPTDYRVPFQDHLEGQRDSSMPIPWLCSMLSPCVKSVGSWLEEAQKVAGGDKCLVSNLLFRIITRPNGDWGTGYHLANESSSENEYSYPAWQANGSKESTLYGVLISLSHACPIFTI